MHIVNPFGSRSGGFGVTDYSGSLPTWQLGQVPTYGVIPFTPTDVSRTTSQYARQPGYQRFGAGFLGSVSTAQSGSAPGAIRMPQLVTGPSPLREGSKAASHASSVAIGKLGQLFGSNIIGRVIQAPPHPIIARPVAGIESVIGKAATVVVSSLKAGGNAARQSLPVAPGIR